MYESVKSEKREVLVKTVSLKLLIIRHQYFSERISELSACHRGFCHFRNLPLEVEPSPIGLIQPHPGPQKRVCN